MLKVQAKIYREGLFFFFLSLPLLACSEHRCTRQEGFLACWREAGCCTTNSLWCCLLLTGVLTTLIDKAYPPKKLCMLFITISHRTMYICQLYLCFCLLQLLNGLTNLKKMAISSQVASHHQLFHFQGPVLIECGLKGKYWCWTLTVCKLDSEICGMKLICCWMSANTRWLPGGSQDRSFGTGSFFSPAHITWGLDPDPSHKFLVQVWMPDRLQVHMDHSMVTNYKLVL